MILCSHAKFVKNNKYDNKIIKIIIKYLCNFPEMSHAYNIG